MIYVKHFIGGSPSIEPGNPDFVPSQFLETEHNNHQSNKRKSEGDVDRFDRLKVRVLKPNEAQLNNTDENDEQVCLKVSFVFTDPGWQ